MGGRRCRLRLSTGVVLPGAFVGTCVHLRGIRWPYYPSDGVRRAFGLARRSCRRKGGKLTHECQVKETERERDSTGLKGAKPTPDTCSLAPTRPDLDPTLLRYFWSCSGTEHPVARRRVVSANPTIKFARCSRLIHYERRWKSQRYEIYAENGYSFE